MHCLELGLLQLFIPSVLVELTDEDAGVFVGESRKLRYVDAYRQYIRWCKANAVLHSERAPMFRYDAWYPGPSAYPEITMVSGKAAHLRHMMYWLREVCVQCADRQGHIGLLRAAVTDSFVQADLVTRRAGRFFTAAQKKGVWGPHGQCSAGVQCTGLPFCPGWQEIVSDEAQIPRLITRGVRLLDEPTLGPLLCR